MRAKVKITKCSNKDWWYRDKIGKIYSVEWDNENGQNQQWKTISTIDGGGFSGVRGYIALNDCIEIESDRGSTIAKFIPAPIHKTRLIRMEE